MSIRESCDQAETAGTTRFIRGEHGALTVIRGKLSQIQQSWNADRIGEVEQFARWLREVALDAGCERVVAPAAALAALARDSQVHRITDSLTAISDMLECSVTEGVDDESAVQLVARGAHRLSPRESDFVESEDHVLQCLARAAELRAAQTGNHVLRVGRYAAIVARALGINPQHAARLESAARLHDVGKIGVPDAILRKPGALDAAEYEIMKQHCNFGTQILGPSRGDDLASPTVQLAARIAETHHEKWDGSGYPHGLAGQNIPVAGRITAIADVFDALNSRRPYHDPLPRDDCFRIIGEGRGRHFDPAIVDAFFASKSAIVRAQDELRDEYQ